ncbi:hypothetical protein Bca101_101849 [Brassica carinata]
MHRHHATCGALPAAGPYLRLSRFQGGQAICTDGRSARARALGFAATAAPSYSSRPGSCPDGRVSAQLGTVTRLPVHPASPVLLTKNGPLGALDSVGWLNKAATPSYLFKNSFPSSSYPEGNFGGNQLLDGSISLSPLYPSQTNDLHVSIAAGLHQSFLWLRPLRHSSPSFGSRQACSHSNPSQKIKVGRLLGPCFKTGRMGSPQADALSTQMPRHAVRRVLQTTIKAATSPRAELGPGPSLRTLLQTTIRTPKTSDFQAGLFPVRSPLLRESLTLGHQELSDRTTDDITRIEFTTSCRDDPGSLSSFFGQARAVTHWRPDYVRYPREDGGTTICDTQADVPSARRLGAQLAFKDSMVHGILQFTPSIAFRYVLHRCESRDIRCRESF